MPLVTLPSMPETVPPRVQLVARTEFLPPEDVPWSTDADGGQALAEFAGRACYQSWGKPNPVTATNAGYLRHILEVGHLSVLEHGSVSFYLTAILFILFDIEIVFLYPLAVQLDALGWFGLVEFLVFIAVLGVAYVYIWRKGALDWH